MNSQLLDKLSSLERYRPTSFPGPTSSDRARNVAITKAAARAGFDVSDEARVDDLISAVTDVAHKYNERETYLPSRSVHGTGHNRIYYDSWVPGRARSAERTITRRFTRERSPSPETHRRSQYWRDHEAQSASSAQRIVALPPDSKPVQTSVKPVKVGPQRDSILHGGSQSKMICDLPGRVSLQAQEDLHQLSRSPAVPVIHGDNQSKTTSDVPRSALLRAQEDPYRRPRSQPGSNSHVENQLKMISDLPASAFLRAQEDLHPRHDSPLMALQVQSKKVQSKKAQSKKAQSKKEQSKTFPNSMPLGVRTRKHSASTSTFDTESTSQPLKLRRLDDLEKAETTVVHDGLIIKLNEPIERGLHHHNQPAFASPTTTTNTRIVFTPMEWEPSNPVANVAARSERHNVAGQKGQSARRERRNVATETRKEAKQKQQSARRERRILARKRRKEARQNRQPAAATSTTNTFKKLKNWLALSADRVLQERRDLAARWEADPALRELEATHHLSELSGYLGQIEDGVAGAIGVAEKVYQTCSNV